MRDYCLFCWYWLNCWPSLFKLSLGKRLLFVLLILVELLTITVYTFFRWEIIVCFVDVGRIVDHHCLFYFRWEIIVCLLILVELMTVTVYTFFRWQVIVCLVDIGGIIDHPCLTYFRWEIIVCFVYIGGIVDHHCLIFL